MPTGLEYRVLFDRSYSPYSSILWAATTRQYTYFEMYSLINKNLPVMFNQEVFLNIFSRYIFSTTA